MTKKAEKAEQIIIKLRSVANKAINKKKIELAMSAIAACAEIEYSYGQYYTDDALETLLKRVSVSRPSKKENRGESPNKRVIFYDGFGLDTRGLALIYLKALVQLGYEVIYITIQEAKGRQPAICNILREGHGKRLYISTKKGYVAAEKRLTEYILKYQAHRMFIYTTPYDVSGIVAFMRAENMGERFFINLTDHVFWLGKRCFDYCIEFREYGAGISYHYRGINKRRLRLLPYYPHINTDEEFRGFPFDKEDRKILFSGGALYKTIDQNNTFYKMVGTLLDTIKELVFLYAGSGDVSGISRLQEKYPNRVFHINERKDLYQLMCHVDLYLNTYPLMGGLMTQYAAKAGIVPLTLVTKYSAENEGVLSRQDKLNIFFKDIPSLVEEAERLINDKEYRQERAAQLKASVPTEEEFASNLEKIMEGRETGVPYQIIKYDTRDFRKEYLTRLGEIEIIRPITRKINRKLWIYFPDMLLKRLWQKARHIS